MLFWSPLISLVLFPSVLFSFCSVLFCSLALCCFVYCAVLISTLQQLNWLVSSLLNVLLMFHVHLQIRGIFFDRIERNSVVSMIDSIYRHVPSLEGIQFLLKYATTVLPSSPDDPDCGATVYSNIQILQAELTRKREVGEILDRLIGK